MNLIHSTYKLTPPDPQLAQIRAEKVAKLKTIMGEKYLLAKPIQRKTK